MNEKGAVSAIDSFSIKPRAFSSRVQDVLGSLSLGSLQDRLAEMGSLIAETRLLARDVGI
jgi:hypothetical protein